MVSLAFDVLFRIALAASILKYCVDMVRGDHKLSGIALIALLGALAIFLRWRFRPRAPVAVVEELVTYPALLQSLSETDRLRIANLIVSGNQIGAIKITRDLLHVPLLTAKTAVDQLSAALRPVTR